MSARARGRVALAAYAIAVFGFILAPIVSTAIFSFNVNRFPSLPWGGFSLDWYRVVLDDPTIARALGKSLIVAAATSVLGTLIGFGAAYADYRFRFIGKQAYLALASLPPTVPVVILGLAMLTFLPRLSLSGTLQAVVIGHVVIAAPFAMALVRLRLADLDPSLEAAAWNLGATQAAAFRQVIVPFCAPALAAALAITAAVSFDEFMIAWFVCGVNETLPVRILAMLQGQVSPRVNVVGTFVFATSILLVAAGGLVMGAQARRRLQGAEDAT